MDYCIFCKIVKKEIPAQIVYEDENYVGFLDIHPATSGHTLLIPKKHYRWVADVEDFGGYWEIARTIARTIETSLSPKWVQYFTHGAIDHAHIHIIPRYDDVEHSIELPKQPSEPESEGVLRSVADTINKTE